MYNLGMDAKQKPKKIIRYAAVAVVAVAIFGGGFFVGKSSVNTQVCKPESIDFSLFWDTYNKLKDHFVSPEKITNQAILYGAIHGMTQALGDPYTDFFDPDEARTFQQDLAGSFSGIGVEVGLKKDQLTVIAPLKDTPGDRAGLKAGDQIIKIDGTSTTDMAVDQAVGMIRGKQGTKVTLTIFREGWTATKDIVIVRDVIKLVAVDWELKNGDVAYIHMYQFDQNLANDFNTVAHQILQSGAKKIVLDLRNNPGGYLEICQQVAGWFLEKGNVITVEDYGQGRQPDIFSANGNAAFANYPMVILMNSGSASASEILAGALRDDRGVQLVGEKSFGKGSVQEVIDLQDGKSFLKVTVAKWLTPKGASISEIGLNPDAAVEITDEQLKAAKDPQLEKALEIIGAMK